MSIYRLTGSRELIVSYVNVKAVVAAFNQEKALVGAFSVITNLWMELFEALFPSVAGAPARVWWQRRWCRAAVGAGVSLSCVAELDWSTSPAVVMAAQRLVSLALMVRTSIQSYIELCRCSYSLTL